MKRYSMIIWTIVAIMTLAWNVGYSETMGIITGKVVDSDDKGVEKVEVALSGTNIKTLTDSNGQFTLTNVPPGEYTVSVFKDGHFTANMETVKSVADQTTEILFLVNLSESSSIAVTGTVTEVNTNTPVKGARIILESHKVTRTGAETDKQGKFEFPSIPTGIYTIKVVADGYEIKYFEDMILSPGPKKDISLTLEPVSKFETRSFTVKYGSVEEIAKRARPMMSAKGVIIHGSNSFIVKDTKETMERIQKILAEFDIPPKQIWLEVRLLLASSEKKQNSVIPKELGSIAKQLQSLFRYQSYEILDDARYTGLEDEACSFWIGKGDYKVVIFRLDFQDVNGGLIKLEQFDLVGKMGNDYTSFLTTTVNIPNGDTVILGASNVDASGQALIIAVTAKTMELK